MEKRYIRFERWQRDDAIAFLEGVFALFPILSNPHKIAADQAPQRHERQAFFAGLQPCVDSRAGRIADGDLAAFKRGSELRRGTKFAQTDRRRLNDRDTPCTDQHIRLNAALGHRKQMKIARTATDQGARCCHGDKGIIRRHRDHGADLDARRQRVQRYDRHSAQSHRLTFPIGCNG